MADTPTPMLPRPSLAEKVKPARKAGKLRTSRPPLVQQTELTVEEFERLDQVQNIVELVTWAEDTKLRQREKKSKARGYELARLKLEQFLGIPNLMDVLKKAQLCNSDDIRENTQLPVGLSRLEQHGINKKDLTKDVEEDDAVTRLGTEATENEGKKEFGSKVRELPYRQQINLELLGDALGVYLIVKGLV